MTVHLHANGIGLRVPHYVQSARQHKSWFDTLLGASTARPKRVFRTILEDVSLDAADGDRVALIGRNGAGKSSLLRVLTGAYPPTTGWLDVKGQRQALLNISLGFSGEATVEENILLRGTAMGLGADHIRGLTGEILEFSGLSHAAQHRLRTLSAGLRMGHAELVDSMISDGLWDAFNDFHMGVTAENLVNKYGISREAQDAFAASSQQKAVAAIEAGRFKDEITPIEIPQRKGDPLRFDTDEQPRAGTTAEALAKLRPAFKKDGSVTAGNASSLNDGAAAVLLMSADKAKALGMPVLARIKAYANAGVDPAIMGIAPVSATRRCLDKAGWSLDELDLIEANEAFAAQALSVGQELGWNAEKVNVNGGAIALGHPIGASGCRVLVTLLHEMIRRDAKKGLATLCIGGGQGVALAIERT